MQLKLVVDISVVRREKFKKSPANCDIFTIDDFKKYEDAVVAFLKSFDVMIEVKDFVPGAIQITVRKKWKNQKKNSKLEEKLKTHKKSSLKIPILLNFDSPIIFPVSSL